MITKHKENASQRTRILSTLREGQTLIFVVFSSGFPDLLGRMPTRPKDSFWAFNERFWHAGTSDLQSLLSRAGMPAEIIQMVPEVVKGCTICRRFARLKSRPVVKAGHPAFFNEEVQADYFQAVEPMVSHSG